MTDEKRQPRPATQYGPTAKTVAVNVRRARERRGLTIYQLSAALKAADRPIAPSAVAKIEREQRQVTVDDLVAISYVLDISPSALLLPLEDDPSKTVEVTGAGSVAADVAWDWADGRRPLRHDPRGADHTAALEYVLYSRPPRRRGSWDALKDLITVSDPNSPVADVVRNLSEEDPDGPSVD